MIGNGQDRPLSEVIRLPANAVLTWLADYHGQREEQRDTVIRLNPHSPDGTAFCGEIVQIMV
jgi:hypothetical protein